MTTEITTGTDTVEVKTEPSLVHVSTEEPLVVSKISSKEPETKEQWQQIGEEASAFIDKLPSYVADFFSKYQKILVALGWILAAFATVKLTLAILDAINDIPLLALVLELVGLGYTLWFVTRYLLSASNRQELSDTIQAIKEKFLGTGS
ncbi:MAG TPA: CAAD domain-containing protein [Allocoleopsis sp.]